ncbi:hypothetical protein LTR95_001258 [Oleoguttula sp. CCFEE 5521]
MEALPPTLLDLLSNSLVLSQVSPLLPVSALLPLSCTSKSIRQLIYSSREAWRYLDLSPLKSAQLDASPIDVGGVSWRAERMDEALTEDDFYAGPLRGIFSQLHTWKTLKWVQVLVLDGLSVPADLVREIVMEERFGVRILSVRGATHLNLSKLQQVLMYAVRPTRPETEFRFKALYVFGLKGDPKQRPSSTESSNGGGITTSQGAQIGAHWNSRSAEALQIANSGKALPQWYGSSGRVLQSQKLQWAGTLQACEGLIAFDAVLCRGPRHDISKVDAVDYLPLAVATVALGPVGCETCKTSPEGPAAFGYSDVIAHFRGSYYAARVASEAGGANAAIDGGARPAIPYQCHEKLHIQTQLIRICRYAYMLVFALSTAL